MADSVNYEGLNRVYIDQIYLTVEQFSPFDIHVQMLWDVINI